jgi:hypothetical protein
MSTGTSTRFNFILQFARVCDEASVDTGIPSVESIKENIMSFIQPVVRRFGIVGELLLFFANNKRWWLLPMIIVVLLMGIVLILGQSSAIAPFLYPLF